VRGWWERQGYEVTVGDSSGEVFNRAEARNRAASQCDDAVLVFGDADTVASPDLLAQAVEMVEADGGLVYPHNRCVHLSPHGTRQFMAGHARLQTERVARNSPAGVLVISRTLFDEVGRWDEGFADGWGYEDVVFMLACETLGKVRRLVGDLTHLWHPVAAEKRRAIKAQTANRPRSDLYRAAYRDPEKMRALIAELCGIT
jgi:hypothetical protein